MAAITKTAQAKQLLVRYIHEHHLLAGDRLPSQDTFRRAFKFGTTTINSAICELKSEGVLDVRDKVGVYVLDPTAAGHTSYTVALVSRHSEYNLFYASLLTTLQHTLTACGYMVRLFHTTAELENSLHPLMALDEFPGLLRNIESGAIHGIIHMDDFTQSSLDFVRERHIPCIFLGSEGDGIATNGVFLSPAAAVIKACLRIKEFNPRRIALACHQAVMKRCRAAMESIFPGRTEYYTCNGSHDGRIFAESLLAMNAGQRPDWLIFPDDIVALAATSHLARRLPVEQVPRCVIFSALRHQLCFSINNAIYFDSSLKACVNSAVSLLQKAFSQNNMAPGRVIIEYEESAE
jgi:DNA-binding LacI/PurR family transcriptional regulator